MAVRLMNTILKVVGVEPSLLKIMSRSNACVSPLSTSSSSSIPLQSSDVELSYMLYPTNNETPDATKTPLVILHGLFGAKGNLHSVSKHLSSAGRRVVTFDARNHGSSGHVDQMDYPSMAQDLLDLICQLDIKDPAILGHSMGGKTAMCYALHHPELISSLIVGDVSPGPSPGTAVLAQYAQAMNNVDIPQKAGLIKARKQVQVQLASSIPDRNIMAFLLTNLMETAEGDIQWRMNFNAFLNNQELISNFPLTDDAQPFTKPTLFVYGANSDQYKALDQGHIKSLFPSAQIEAIPGAGHFLHAEKPIEFVSIVQEFLQSVESGK